MTKKLNAALLTIKKLRTKNKLLNKKEERAKKKISNLKNIVQELRKTHHLSHDGMYILKEFEDIPAELFKRMHRNVTQKALTKAKYPPHLRCFALTLHFYSPAAYNYVRKTFQLTLPHLSVIRSWYNTIDAEPGFSEECFNTLKLKNEEYRKQNKCLICALIMDEMGIKKGFQRSRDGKMRGYVDIGAGTEGTSNLPEVKNALVMLVVALNDTWKLPMAFFLINGLSAETKANLINDALMRLHEVGVKITSLTLDGPAEHFAAVKRLGASMEMKENAKPHFPHPVKDQLDIHVIIDPCHNLKNIRNALADLSVILDGDNNKIEWRYIKALALLQQDEGLRLGNKLRTIHINYKKMIMKVFLAAQTLSASVADAIEFCWKVLHLPEFKDCEATVQFIRCVDYVFDFLNVRNPWGKGFKSPLKSENEYIWRPKVLSAINYLSRLKLFDHKPIYSCSRKTGFIGFYTAVLSSIAIFDHYVKPVNGPLKMLLTYKLSQDHIELLFAAIRARSGWCPNPTVAQFISAYKRLLIRHDVEVSTGNTQLMDKTKILNVSVSTKKKIATIDRYDPTVYNAVENLRIKQKYGLDSNKSNSSQNTVDDLKQFLHFAWAVPNNLSEFATQTIGYIAGYVVRKLPNTVECAECIAGCKVLSSVTCKNNIVNSQNATALIIAKNRGGLIVPSESVVIICTVAEQMFRKACNCNMGKPPIETNFPAVLANTAYKKLLLSKKKIFS